MSKGEQIFDLKKLVSNSGNDVEIKTSSNNVNEQNRLLEGYRQIPNVEWVNLKQADHIRYLRKDGNFRKGGYIKDIITKEDELIKIDLVNNFSYKAIAWTIYADNIDKIWVKELDSSGSNISDLDDLKYKMETMDNDVKVIKKEIQKINNEQKKLIELIRKLNKKINNR